MRFAPTLPADFYGISDVGDYHLAQAHILVSNPTACGIFQEWSLSNDHHTILDNGAAEAEGGKGDPDTLLRVATYLHPNEVVCPDAVMDAATTVKLCEDYARDCDKVAKQVMLVPQGNSVPEWCDCCQQLLVLAREFGFTPTIGVTKFLEACPGGRQAAVSWVQQYLRTRAPRYRSEVHLLGCAEGIQEMGKLAAMFPWVRGGDTTYPYLLASQGLVVQEGTPKRDLTEEEWHPDPIPPELVTLTTLNIAICRQVVGDV